MVDVMEKNNNLFGIYMKRLRVYDERWQGFAQRLVTWMNSDKAYYPEARPKVRLALSRLDRLDRIYLHRFLISLEYVCRCCSDGQLTSI